MVKNKEQINHQSLDPMAVTWTEKYADTIENVWSKLPPFMRSSIATVAIFLLGLSVNGEWLNIAVHIAKQFGFSNQDAISNKVTFKWSEISLESLRLQNLQYYVVGSFVVSYGLYFGIGGFLHWYFYVRQRDRPEEWKCQPKKFMKPDLERHEILTGSTTLVILNIVTSMMACYISNGGYSTVYYDLKEYSLWWFFLQIPLLFLYQDYITYWLHRWYHMPFLYKRFHKLHHKYTHPTAFSVTAIHPVEAVHIQLVLSIPVFTIPVHWGPFYLVSLYAYYHGIIDHSGINFKSYWWQPWQPDAIFHDNHHQYFHVNFGFNCYFWDKLHGTYRRKDRLYTEDTYYGTGKHLSQVSEAELKADMQERLSENPAAYRENQLEFELTQKDLKSFLYNKQNGNSITTNNRSKKSNNTQNKIR